MAEIDAAAKIIVDVAALKALVMTAWFVATLALIAAVGCVTFFASLHLRLYWSGKRSRRARAKIEQQAIEIAELRRRLAAKAEP